MLLAVGTVAVAGLLSYALLSSAATQVQASAERLANVQARLAAQSGVDLARHRLLHAPDEAARTAAVKALAVEGGTVGVSVEPQGQSGIYAITAVGRAGSGGRGIAREIGTTVQLQADREPRPWQNKAVVQFNGAVDVRASRFASVSGGPLQHLASDGLMRTLYGTLPANIRPTAAAGPSVPDFDDLRLVREIREALSRGETVLGGSNVKINLITSDKIQWLPEGLNVFRGPGKLTINKQVGFKGSLVVLDAELRLENGGLSVEPSDKTVGLPVLLVGGELHVHDTKVDAKGVIYANRLTAHNKSTELKIFGRLFVGERNAAANLSKDFEGAIVATQDDKFGIVKDLTAGALRPVGLTTRSYTQSARN